MCVHLGMMHLCVSRDSFATVEVVRGKKHTFKIVNSLPDCLVFRLSSSERSARRSSTLTLGLVPDSSTTSASAVVATKTLF